MKILLMLLWTIIFWVVTYFIHFIMTEVFCAVRTVDQTALYTLAGFVVVLFAKE